MAERSPIVESVAGAGAQSDTPPLPLSAPIANDGSAPSADGNGAAAPFAVVMPAESLPPGAAGPPALPPPLPVAAANGAAPNGLPPTAASVLSSKPVNPSTTAEGDDDFDEPSDSIFAAWWDNAPSWLTSMVVHVALVLCLALITIATGAGGRFGDMSVSIDGEGGGGGGIEELDSRMMQADGQLEQQPLEEATPDLTDATKLTTLASNIGLIAPDAPKIGNDAGMRPFGGEGSGGGGGVGDNHGPGGGGLGLRMDANARGEALRSGGGTPQSEEAVRRALHWLAEHQDYDGSWSFDHQKSPKCHSACNNPGFTPGKIAATSLALLPFLGSGHTHQEGAYKRTVDSGLRYLVRSMHITGNLGSLYEQGGQMYGHGLASIVLCEAYGMTHDHFLENPAQTSVNFIVEAQDPNGGGWRYLPQQPGDTSVVGWQLMALKSAQMAYLRVPAMTMRKAGYFLDHVQSDRGAVYGYQGPERSRPSTTAIGLLCRMYLGWNHDQNALQRGVQIFSVLGPSTDKSRVRNNMYYNYYATQVMHHYGGSEWRRWNEIMREYLIETQGTKGHETGSWFFDGMDHGSPAGGRLYCTAMAAMTLEVYYRHMPLYRPQTIQNLPSKQ